MSTSVPKATKEITEVILPSGLSGTIRRLKLKEMNLLSSKTENKKGNILEKLFKEVWLETTDIGPYKSPFVDFKKDSNGEPIIDWHNVFDGDRNALLLFLRMHTRGNKFNFDFKCKRCGHLNPLTLDLSSLTVYKLSDKVKDKLSKTGKNEFSVTLPFSGVQVDYKILQGFDQNNLSKTLDDRKDDQFTASLEPRLIYISGIEKPKDRKKFIDNMDLEDLEFLQDEFFENDPGIQMDVEIECLKSACEKTQRVTLPLDDDFFLTRQRLTRRRSTR
jgi:hypothetical protein